MTGQRHQGDDFAVIQAGRERQQLEDDAIHRWYRFVLAYPDHLITEVLDRLSVAQDALVLDPFCGTGTTLVECKKMGIDSVGIDASPASVLASRVKINWTLDPDTLAVLVTELIDRVQPTSDALMLSDTPLFADEDRLNKARADLMGRSDEARYLVESGMIDREWIDEVPFLISIALLLEINGLQAEEEYKDLLRLLLASCMVEDVANVRFGPEIYVSKGSGTYDVLSVFKRKAEEVLEDLDAVRDLHDAGNALALEGDSRECAEVLGNAGVDTVDHVITSPPYPTEKDYTRNTRLELVYLGFVHDSKSLRRIKKRMVRSHSKGIYKADTDGELVSEIPEIKAIADELREKIKTKTYGFAKLYPRIIEEYFGGMYRHLRTLAEVIRPGGTAAYVVGEQRTYLQTFTPTGTLLAQLAERPEVGFRVIDIPVWRVRRGTTGSGDDLKEEIVILERC